MTSELLTGEDAYEGSSFDVSVTFDDGATPPVPVTPTACTWTLCRPDGEVVNSQEDKAIAAEDLAPTVTVKLDPADLVLPDGIDNELRVVKFEATYDDGDGDERTLRRQRKFVLRSQVGVDAADVEE